VKIETIITESKDYIDYIIAVTSEVTEQDKIKPRLEELIDLYAIKSSELKFRQPIKIFSWNDLDSNETAKMRGTVRLSMTK